MKRQLSQFVLSFLICCISISLTAQSIHVVEHRNSSTCADEKYVSQKLMQKGIAAYAGLASVTYCNPLSDNAWDSYTELSAIANSSGAQGYEAEMIVLFDCDGKILSLSVISENNMSVSTQIKNSLINKPTSVRGYFKNTSVQFYTTITLHISSNTISVL